MDRGHRLNGHPARSLALAVSCGLLLALSFPLGPPLPFLDGDGWWPAGWICLSPLMLAASRARRARGAAALGLLAGFTAYTMILCWLHPFLIKWARLSVLEAAGVTSLLILYVSLYHALFAAVVHRWSRRWGSGVAFLLAPAAWTALELARGVLITGFPWCLLGYSQQPVAAAIQVADLAGVYGVSFLLASAGAALAWVLDWWGGAATARRGRAALVPAVLLAFVAAGVGYGAWRIGEPPATGQATSIALIQANVAQVDKWEPAERDRIEADHVKMTREAARRGAKLIVWSETAVPTSISRDPGYLERLESLAGETGADLLLGTVIYEARDGALAPFNSAVLVRPGSGLAGRYDKIHLVPFGEYVPLRRLLFFLAPLVHEASNFQPGNGIRILEGQTGSIGTVICYEAIFPDLTRRYTRAGAALIVNITNDAWYGETAMPRQHLRQTALRAVENRRWLIRCANTGISAVIDPLGRIVARARFEHQEIVEATIVPVKGATLYATIGDAFAIGCVILTLAALAASTTTISRRRRTDPSGGHDAR